MIPQARSRAHCESGTARPGSAPGNLREDGSREAVACGVDIEELARFDRHARSADSQLLRDICTEREIRNLRPDRRLHLALAFSCKEATFKALGATWTNSDVSWRDIELLFSGLGFDEYRIELSGRAKEIFDECGANHVAVSLAHNDEYVLVEVLLLSVGNRGHGC